MVHRNPRNGVWDAKCSRHFTQRCSVTIYKGYFVRGMRQTMTLLKWHFAVHLGQLLAQASPTFITNYPKTSKLIVNKYNRQLLTILLSFKIIFNWQNLHTLLRAIPSSPSPYTFSVPYAFICQSRTKLIPGSIIQYAL